MCKVVLHIILLYHCETSSHSHISMLSFAQKTSFLCALFFFLQVSAVLSNHISSVFILNFGHIILCEYNICSYSIISFVQNTTTSWQENSFCITSLWENNPPVTSRFPSQRASNVEPDSKVHGANMGPIWGRQDPGGPHVGHMNFAIWGILKFSLLLLPLKLLNKQSIWHSCDVTVFTRNAA